MKKTLMVGALLGFAVVRASFADAAPSPVLNGTINVVVANANGIVVLTDSMITEVWQDEHGVRRTRQRTEPAQKLFRLDDHSVCAFAGFASAPTPPLPDFINNVSGVIGRYEDDLRRYGRLISFKNELQLLENLFSYYISGVANLRDEPDPSNYSFELFLAGYDLDGVPKVGSVKFGVLRDTGSSLPLWTTRTIERVVVPITSTDQIIFLHGKTFTSRLILDNPAPWISDLAISELSRSTTSHHWRGDSIYETAFEHDRALTLGQMKAVAISLKRLTAEVDREVGGADQIAVLKNGKVDSLDQPSFPAVPISGFKFKIFSALGADGSGHPGKPSARAAVVVNLIGLYFANRFVHIVQPLDEGYFLNNYFRDCVITYEGGDTFLSASNNIVDSDLVISPSVTTHSATVERLLRDFKWRSIDDKRTANAGRARKP